MAAASLAFPLLARCERPRTASFSASSDQPGRFAQGPEEKQGLFGLTEGFISLRKGRDTFIIGGGVTGAAAPLAEPILPCLGSHLGVFTLRTRGISEKSEETAHFVKRNEVSGANYASNPLGPRLEAKKGRFLRSGIPEWWRDYASKPFANFSFLDFENKKAPRAAWRLRALFIFWVRDCGAVQDLERRG